MVSQTFIVYDIHDQSDTQISVEGRVGYGQTSASNVRINQNVIGEFDGNFLIGVGTSKELKSKTLNIYTTIHDIQPTTDKVYFEITLGGGKSPHHQVILDSSVPKPGSFATTIVSIFFI